MVQSLAIVGFGRKDTGELEKAVSQAASRHGLAITVNNAGNADKIRASDLVILFGNCDFQTGMTELAGGAGILEALEHVVLVEHKPILGIGCGMMLFAEQGPESKPCFGLGWIPGRVHDRDPASNAIMSSPHQKPVSAVKGHPLFAGIEEAAFSFLRSCRFDPENEAHVLATAKDDNAEVIAVERDNIAGVLFHPELSGESGEQILANFLHWTPP